MVSGTIQLPSELYWISPPFKIKRQISRSSLLDLTGRITLFLLDSPGARGLYLSPFSKSPHKTEHCGILVLKLCIFKYQANLKRKKKEKRKKMYYFFLLHFSTCKKKKNLYIIMCVVYLYYNLYYVLCIIV